MKAKKNYEEMAFKILPLIGGKENVSKFLHCMTRLRITPKNQDNVNIKEIEALDFVIKVQVVAGTIQIVLGPGTVNEVHEEFSKLVGLDGAKIDENLDDIPKQSFGAKIITMLQAMVMPTIGIMGGVALINALVTVLTLFGFAGNHPSIAILGVMGGIVTSYLGIYFAYSTSKFFGGTPFIGVTLALFIYAPQLQGIEYMGIILQPGIGGVIGIVIISIIATFIERWLKKVIRKDLQLIFLPFFTILLTLIPMMFVVIPVAGFLTEMLVYLFDFAINGNDYIKILTYGILGGLWGLLVMSGLHVSLVVVLLPIAAETGVGPFMAAFQMLTASLIGLTIAVLIKEKNNKTIKEIGINGIIIALTGITEPLLYGISISRIKSLFYVVTSGFFGGIVLGFFHIDVYFPAAMGIFQTLNLVDIKSKWIFYLLSWLVAGGLAFAMYMISPQKENKQ